MTESLFQVDLNIDAINMLNNIPTLTNPPLQLVPIHDCVENTLNFLGVITSSQASQLQLNSCTQLETKVEEILNLFNKRFPNFIFSERLLSFNDLFQKLLPGKATFGGLLRSPGTGHAVIFVKDNFGNMYLVDRQQNIKFLNADIYKYINFLNLDNTKLLVYSGIELKPKPPQTQRQPNPQTSSSFKFKKGGKKKHTKNKSRKNKSRKNKSRKNKKR
jgi:hypothetical protein